MRPFRAVGRNAISYMFFVVAPMMQVAKGQITTVNADAAGPLLRYVEGCSSRALLIQEHRMDEASLPSFQGRLLDLGYHGVFAPALKTANDDKKGSAMTSNELRSACFYGNGMRDI